MSYRNQILLSLLFAAFLGFGGGLPVQAQVRLLTVDTGNETVSLKNFGSSAVDVSTYNFCLGPGFYNQLNNYTNVTGSLNIAPGGILTIDLTSGNQGVTSLNDVSGGLGLFINPAFSSNSPNDLGDFVQWGAGNQPRVGQAVNASRWPSAADFVAGQAPYNFAGGANDIGSSFWNSSAAPARVRFLEIDTQNERVTLKNFGGTTEDLTNYNFCLGPGRYNQLNDYTNITGSLQLAPNATVTFDLTSGSAGVTALDDTAGLTLFINPAFGSSSANDISDYAQWGAANQARVGQSVAAGRWTNANDFIEGASPFVYLGGGTDIGADFWVDDTRIRLSRIIPEGDEVVVKNFDSITRDVSGYFFCTQAGIYPQLGNPAQVQVLNGDLVLDPGEEVTVRVLTFGGVVDSIGSIFIFNSNLIGFNNDNPAVLKDFAQWGGGNGFRVGNAVNAGRWDDVASFIPNPSPFDYIGGANDIGVAFWVNANLGILAPSNLAITYNTQFLPKLTWEDNANNEDGFTLERRIGNGSFSPVVSLGANVESFVDTVLEFGVDVSYRVSAFNSTDVSDFSNVATFQQPAQIQDLELDFICFDSNTQQISWEVNNPNSVGIFYIYATWSDNPRQQDTLIASPGLSGFTTNVTAQNPATPFDDNTTGIWWIDEKLTPDQPFDVFGDRGNEAIDLNESCGVVGRVPDSPEAPSSLLKGKLSGLITVVATPTTVEDDILSSVRVRPNPFQDRITLEANEVVGIADIRLLDAFGREVLRMTSNLRQEISLETSGLSEGLYFLEVRHSNLVKRIKLIKQ